MVDSERRFGYTAEQMNWILVGLGAALGGMARYGVSRLFAGQSGAFPWATFGVNVLGSLAIGALSGWLAHGSGNPQTVRAFAVVGFCGGFTTFSTFSNEMFGMLESGRFGMMCIYAFGSVAAGLAAVWIGYRLAGAQ